MKGGWVFDPEELRPDDDLGQRTGRDPSRHRGGVGRVAMPAHDGIRSGDRVGGLGEGAVDGGWGMGTITLFREVSAYGSPR